MRFTAFSLLASALLGITTTGSRAADDDDALLPVVPRPASAKWQEVKADKDGSLWLKTADKAEWELIDRANGASLDVPPGSTAAVFRANPLISATYRAVSTSGDGKLLRYAIVVGEGGPQPGPGPNPVPPKPVDDLTKALQAAYATDASPTKASDLRQLIALYLEAVKAAGDPRFTTADQLFSAVRDTAAELIPDVGGVRRLAGVRKIIGGELSAVLPADPDATLTESVRAAAAAAFAKYAKALQGVTP